MKVAYFSNQFATKSGHGIATYAHHLFDSMREVEDVDLIPVAAWSNRDANDLFVLQQRTGLRLLPTGRRMTPIAWTWLGYPRVETWLPEVDIVHAISLGYPIATRKPFVVTVHDIGPLTHPEYFSSSPPWIMEKALSQAVRQAAMFICVSQATADELQAYVERHFNKSLEDRIAVVHEGVDEKFYRTVDPHVLDGLEGLPAPDAPFLLTVGKTSPRKNLESVIKALELCREKIPHHLVAVGGKGWDSEVLDAVVCSSSVNDRIHLLGYVTDDQLVALYQRAAAYMHPSLFEGFGLTILEAMAARCPVVTSNVFSLPEVAGDAAVLVDPTDPIAIANGIVQICTDAAFADDCRRRGVERARTFSWAQTACEVADIYRNVLQSPPHSRKLAFSVAQTP